MRALDAARNLAAKASRDGSLRTKHIATQKERGGDCKGRRGGYGRPVQVNGKLYRSVRYAARENLTTEHAVKKWIAEGWAKYV